MRNLFTVPTKWNADVVGWIYLGLLVGCMLLGQMAFALELALVLLASFEWRAMRKQGVAWPSSAWALVFPVYLWKRLNALGLPKRLFWIWTGALAALLALGLLLGGLAMSADDLPGTWRVDIDSTLEQLDGADGKHPTPDQYEALVKMLEAQYGNLRISFSDNMMSVSAPPIPPIPSSYEVVETAPGHVKIKNEEGKVTTVEFLGWGRIKLLTPEDDKGLVMYKE